MSGLFLSQMTIKDHPSCLQHWGPLQRPGRKPTSPSAGRHVETDTHCLTLTATRCTRPAGSHATGHTSLKPEPPHPRHSCGPCLCTDAITCQTDSGHSFRISSPKVSATRGTHRFGGTPQGISLPSREGEICIRDPARNAQRQASNPPCLTELGRLGQEQCQDPESAEGAPGPMGSAGQDHGQLPKGAIFISRPGLKTGPCTTAFLSIIWSTMSTMQL